MLQAHPAPPDSLLSGEPAFRKSSHPFSVGSLLNIPPWCNPGPFPLLSPLPLPRQRRPRALRAARGRAAAGRPPKMAAGAGAGAAGGDRGRRRALGRALAAAALAALGWLQAALGHG